MRKEHESAKATQHSTTLLHRRLAPLKKKGHWKQRSQHCGWYCASASLDEAVTGVKFEKQVGGLRKKWR
jgi:hypothetical protein